jgi:hypothetical protein
MGRETNELGMVSVRLGSLAQKTCFELLKLLKSHVMVDSKSQTVTLAGQIKY